jgi:hypothetical protein
VQVDETISKCRIHVPGWARLYSPVPAACTGLPKSEALCRATNEMHARRTAPAASSEAIRLGVRLERAPAWERLAAFRLSADPDIRARELALLTARWLTKACRPVDESSQRRATTIYPCRTLVGRPGCRRHRP